MQLRAALAKVGIISFIALLSSSQAMANEYHCTQLMYDHGLATAAQLDCGYSSYNHAVIVKANQCMTLADQHGKTAQLQGALKAGLADFHDEFAAASSKPLVCADFADQFGMFVTP